MKIRAILFAAFILFGTTAYSQKITSGEYFYDTDPGVGNGIALAALTAGDSVSLNVIFSTVGLPAGLHQLYIRFKDSLNQWGIADPYPFSIYDTTPPVVYQAAQLTRGEYFIDNDPGAGNGTSFGFSTADSVNSQLNISVSGLPAGQHIFCIRYRDAQGKWGIAEPEVFQVCSSMPATPGVTGNTQVTVGDTLKLYASTIAGASGYYWTGPNNYTATLQNIAIPNAQVNNGGEYKVVAVRTGGTACDTSAAGSMTVSVPVKWLDIKAWKENNDVKVLWQTANETNNDRYEIERAVNNQDFERVGIVKGAGSSKDISTYLFTDPVENVIFNTLLYRIKQIDFSNRFEYSRVVVVNIPLSTSDPRLIIYPNPSKGEITLDGVSPEGGLITDIFGKAIITIPQNGTYKTGMLKAGMYFMVSGSQTIKLIVE